MTRFLLKRALWGFVTLFIFVTVLFFAAQILMPGDFASQFRLFMSEAEVDQVRESLGIDLPLWQQYLNWLKMLVRGNLGVSYWNNQPVIEILWSVLPLTVFIFGLGTIVAFLLGLWLGKVTAWKRKGLASGTATFSAVMLYTSFPPWLAFLMTYVIGRRLLLLRNIFDLESSRIIWQGTDRTAISVLWFMLATVAAVALFLILVNRLLQRRSRRQLPSMLITVLVILGPVAIWYLLGLGTYTLDILFTLGLPLLTFILLTFGETMLIMRTSMMDTVHEEYILTARAKGVPDKTIRDRHAARNALLPVFSRLVTSIPYLLTGLIILEYAFGFSQRSGLARLRGGPDTWGGLGSAMFGALVNQDMLVVVGALLFVGILSLFARLILDILHAYLDPRIRYGDSSVNGSG